LASGLLELHRLRFPGSGNPSEFDQVHVSLTPINAPLQALTEAQISPGSGRPQRETAAAIEARVHRWFSASAGLAQFARRHLANPRKGSAVFAHAIPNASISEPTWPSTV